MLLTALTIVVWGADNQVGTWNSNLAKSKYSPGPAPKSNTVTITAVADGIHLSTQGVDAAGKPTHVEYTAKYDGQDYPATGIAYADTVALTRINDNMVEAVLKKAGTPVMTVKTTVSSDGKTRTSVFTGKNEKGQDVNNTVVFDKK
jgi:hypothetical protein